ncbi:MAG: type III pantothenate kinase [Faecalibacterium sp.]|nr:type III pantothenate kinase [Ruminococcus sp.]MCM1392851.1 type III pantothenate kinase [Ruminococcus sp.]MCM1486410.1 type III pantothenate kinase [Faecalibacterium sp.]
MILVFDIGNTNITIGCYDAENLIFVSRMYTERHKTGDEFAAQILSLFELYNVKPTDFTGAVLSSVVPELTAVIEKAIYLTIKKQPIIVGKEHNGHLKIEVLPVEHLGADLVAGCVAAAKKYPLPCLVVDLGTATKILALDKDGYFVGCTISPGVKISLDSLASKASLLPSVNLTKPERSYGTNTVECMQAGVVYGTAAMIDGMTKRIINELGFENTTIVATGGYSNGIIPCCEAEIIYDENLLLDGLKAIYDDSMNN